MKQLYLLVSFILVLNSQQATAQNDYIYFWKGAVKINQLSIKTADLDSITFKRPVVVSTMTIGTQTLTTKNLDVVTYINDSIYFWKGGVKINQLSIKTADLDSITFKIPVVVSTMTIGTQKWTTKNLDVVTYRDGTPIPQVTDPTEWAGLTTGAWCYYDNDPSNGTTYGKLYNWYAVAGIHDTDPNTPNKILAPTGYHIPTDAEWTTLTDYLGGYDVAGGKMKETGVVHWDSPNQDATNSSGFTGLPGGYRFYDGTFGTLGNYGYLWSSSKRDTTYAWFRSLNYYYGSTYSYIYYNKTNGFSVRCIMD